MNQPVINNTFNEVLVGLRKGEVLTELSHAMQEAIQSVKEHGKSATVILKLEIAAANGDASQVSVTEDISTKLPKPPKQNSIFFTTDQNTLSRRDPNQQEMVLQEVQRPALEAAPPLAKVS